MDAIPKIEDVRKAFESWAAPQGIDCAMWIPGQPQVGYANERTNDYWRGWLGLSQTHTAELAAREAEIAGLWELLAGCRTVFALALDNGKNEQYASLETRRGSFIHCVKLMQDLDAVLTKQPPKD